MRRSFVAAAAVAIASLSLVACTKHGDTLARHEDPVVLTGAQLPKLLGADPARVVAYAFDYPLWVQIPVQVDERDDVNPSTVLHRATGATYSGTTTPLTFLTYMQPQASLATRGYTWWPTYVGTDHDLTFDANDEVSFLADDSGTIADTSFGSPPGVDVSSRTEIVLTDPLDRNGEGAVYLFRTPSSPTGTAPTSGVQYTFSLDAGDYKANYGMGTASLSPNNKIGPNPEHSTVTTSSYHLTFGDRWLNDGLKVTTAGSDGADLLERGRVQFPGTCTRSEDTFDDAIVSNPYEGAFSANISGPLRAIRAHIGTNSGTYTTSTTYFYPQREDQRVDLRVHPVPGVQVFDDLTTGLAGLTYADDLAPGGVTVDGSPDSLPAGAPAWQLITSSVHGAYVTASTIDSDIAGLAPTRYYQDQNPASPAPCTGDAAAWGQFGTSLAQSLPCTDPSICASANRLASTRTRWYEPSGTTAATAQQLRDRAATPLVVTVA